MNDYGELFNRGTQILNDREQWEQRQRLYSKVRSEGIRRRRKPWVNAADFHIRLVDQKINQKKAFALATLVGQPQLASFRCLRQQDQEQTDSAAAFFDFELKHRTAFIKSMMVMEDIKQLRGKGVLKVYVDPFDQYKIIFEAIDPLFILMPDDVTGFEDSYEWVHVRQIPKAIFANDRRWCSEYRDDRGDIDGPTIKKLCGGTDALERISSQRGLTMPDVQTDKELREGYTHSPNADTVIVWEHHVRTMGGVTVYPYVPQALDIIIRNPYGIPYKANGNVSAPYFEFNAEVLGENTWYSSRGLAEKNYEMEIYACMLQNAKADSITFYTNPQFVSEVGVQNPANYRNAPGEVLPPGVKRDPPLQPPVIFEQEIMFARSETELNSQSPDMGIEKPGERGNEKRTAKEVGVASSIAQIGQTYEGTLSNVDLTRLYNHAWGLMLQYKRPELVYFVSDDLKTLTEEALHDDYLIEAGGATENWDKQQRIARSSQRYQLLLGKPNVNQDELLTELLSAEDARLTKKLLIPTQQKQQNEMEDETNEIVSMMVTHFPAPVNPSEDHLTRAKTIIQFLQAQDVKAIKPDPLALQRIDQHLQQHIALLKKQNPNGFKQLQAWMKQQMQQRQQHTMQRPMVSAPMPRRNLPMRIPPMRPATASPMRML